ncbi:MAG: hypothetical protein AAFQ61_09585 [Cyanobacteria bacterium J06626_23]
MVRLVGLLFLVIVLVILALQNLSPTLTLVVFGSQTLTLPFSAWLLGAVAVGVFLTLLIYGLLGMRSPPRRPYRPLGQRIRPETSEPDTHHSDARRYESSPYPSSYAAASSESSPGPSRAVSSGSETQTATPHDEPRYENSEDAGDWGTYSPPEQWEDWGQRPEPAASSEPAAPRQGFRFRQDPYSPDTVMDDIESGWEEGYEAPTYDERTGGADYAGSAYDDRYDSRETDRYPNDYSDLSDGWETNAGATPRVYEDGNLYQPDTSGEYGSSERDETMGDIAAEDEPEDVYDADFRVIIPPYEPPNEENDRDPA